MITRENYEEIMFLLIEEQFSEEQKTAILTEIKADPFLTAEWENWSQSKISDDLSAYDYESVTWSDTYLKEKFSPAKKTRGIFYVVLPLAASLMLFLSVKQLNKMEINYHYLPLNKYSAATKPSQHVDVSHNNPLKPAIHTAPLKKAIDSTGTLAVTAGRIPVDSAQTMNHPIQAKDFGQIEPQVLTKVTKPAVAEKYHINIVTEKVSDESVEPDRTGTESSHQKVDLGNLLTNTDLFLDINESNRTPLIRIRGSNKAQYSLLLQQKVK